MDDEQGVRDILRKTLFFMGYDVSVAGSGHEGLSLFRESPFDLVLTDLDMSGLDGWALAFQIKTTSPATPVVVITGQPKENVAEKMKDCPVDLALFKPFTLREMTRTLQTTLIPRS